MAWAASARLRGAALAVSACVAQHRRGDVPQRWQPARPPSPSPSASRPCSHCLSLPRVFALSFTSPHFSRSCAPSVTPSPVQFCSASETHPHRQGFLLLRLSAPSSCNCRSIMAMSALAPVRATGSMVSCQLGRKPWAVKDSGATKLTEMNAPFCSLNRASFSGIRLQVRTPANVRNHTTGVSVRAAGAKGDYLVQKVSARELDDILANKRSSPMVVDFYATWCGPCILLAQELEQLAVEYGDRVRFLKIDTDEEHELANQMQIRGLPTMVFVSPDAEKLAIRTEGLLPTNTIRDIIEKEL